MLNSVQMSTEHYSMKLKSMFDLALASQRYSNNLSSHPQQHQQSANFLHRQQPYPSQSFSSPHNLASQSKSQIVNNSSAGSILVPSQMKGSGGRGGGEDAYTIPQRSPQPIETCPKAHASPLSPIVNLDSTLLATNYNNNNLIGESPLPPHLNQQSLNFVETRGLIHADGEGKSRGKKQGSSGGNKTSFSIESLLAHSNSWRRNNQQELHAEGATGKGKESRFSPYPVSHQTQQGRGQSRQNSGDNIGSRKNSGADGLQTENTEKRSESYGGNNGSKSGGNGRRAAKSKRVRTIFTPEQLERLEAEFERQQYMVGPERLYLASSLYLTEAQVKVWFQNRRIKWRKQHLEMEQQRLAIYRTLAEQDIMSSVDDEDQEENDCDYAVDEGDYERALENDAESPHSQCTNSQRLHHQHPPQPLPPAQHSPQISSPSDKQDLHALQQQHSSVAPSKQSKALEYRHRIQMQQTLSNEEYDTVSPSTSDTSTPSSSSSTLRADKTRNHCSAQGVKK